MTQALPQVSLNDSRLVRYLNELSLVTLKSNQDNFAEHLARLINFSDSIKLSAIHEELADMAFEAIIDTSADDIKNAFLNTRTALVQLIIKSFSTGAGPARVRLPSATDLHSPEELADFSAYRQFYLALQREMDFKIQALHADIRDGAASLSLALAQLVKLDTALSNALSTHVRKAYTRIPNMLEKRFLALYQAHQQGLSENQQGLPDHSHWFQAGGWIAQFNREMQGLLLAELETRLQPVLGLIEAINEENEKEAIKQ